MPPEFTRALARRFDEKIPLTVTEAAEGDALARGRVFIAPGDYHMVFDSRGVMHLSTDPPVWGVRPAADVMMNSAADVLRTPLIAVVLTGMGQDGAQGIVSIKHAGGAVFAQDEASCVIYGMPKAAAATGCCDSVLSLAQIPQRLVEVINERAA